MKRLSWTHFPNKKQAPTWEECKAQHFSSFLEVTPWDVCAIAWN